MITSTLFSQERKPRQNRGFRRSLYQRAILESFLKLDPRHMLRNPVMFVVEVGSLLTTVLWIQAWLGHGEAPAGFIGCNSALAMVYGVVCQFFRGCS